MMFESSLGLALWISIAGLGLNIFFGCSATIYGVFFLLKVEFG